MSYTERLQFIIDNASLKFLEYHQDVIYELYEDCFDKRISKLTGLIASGGKFYDDQGDELPMPGYDYGTDPEIIAKTISKKTD